MSNYWKPDGYNNREYFKAYEDGQVSLRAEMWEGGNSEHEDLEAGLLFQTREEAQIKANKILEENSKYFQICKECGVKCDYDYVDDMCLKCFEKSLTLTELHKNMAILYDITPRTLSNYKSAKDGKKTMYFALKDYFIQKATPQK